MVDISFIRHLWDILITAKEIYELTREEKEKLSDPENYAEFHNNKEINSVIIKGDNNKVFIANYDHIPKEAKQVISDNFNDKVKIEDKRDIKIIEDEFNQRIEKHSKIKLRPPKISEYYKVLDIETINILSLAVKVKYFYENDPKESHKIKGDIGEQYGKDGRKLCNLYTQGYVDDLLKFLTVRYDDDIENISAVIKEEMNKLIRNSEFIFFIHDSHKVEEISIKIKLGIKSNKKYIALHSAGNNTKKGMDIFKSVEVDARNAGYKIIEEHSVNKKGTRLYHFYLIKNS